jgi:hypothetical protein
MSKQMKWIALAVGLLWLAGCTHNSEAKVTVFNKSALSIYVTIYRTSSLIASGQTDTFTLTWPGRSDMSVSMNSYQLGHSELIQSLPLVLKDGDDITVNVEF